MITGVLGSILAGLCLLAGIRQVVHTRRKALVGVGPYREGPVHATAPPTEADFRAYQERREKAVRDREQALDAMLRELRVGYETEDKKVRRATNIAIRAWVSADKRVQALT